ncbi:Hypp7897 [Branchiostoma lanceolatum]|uniref:Hypp7897 protein n=1 Tax=Branchiostoma lanceolatum TaxID=7740 RepID=A0A8J9Z477_BRALA|nr:Hypp7897 [Branchiostoma lanceolatum]
MYAGVGTTPKVPTSTAMASAGHVKTGQGQSQAITSTEHNTNTTDAVVTSGHDQIRQGESQPSAQTLKVGNRSNKVLAALDPNPMYAGGETLPKGSASIAMAIGHDQTGQGPSQAITEHNKITTDAVVTSGTNQIGQGESQALAQTLKVGNRSHKVLAALDPNPMYAGGETLPKDSASIAMAIGHDQTGQGQSQAIPEHNTNTTASVVTNSHHGQMGQGEPQAFAQTPIAGNLSHRDVLAALQPNPMYTYVGKGTQSKGPTSTAMASGHDLTGQGPSQAITKSNTNTTADVVTSGHGQAGRAQATVESLEARNASYGSGPTASQSNSLYRAVGSSHRVTEHNTNTTASVVSSSHDQTGQGQSQVTTESLDAAKALYGTGLTSSQLNSLYKVVGTSQNKSNSHNTATVMTSGHDQTGQGQSQSITEFSDATNPSYGTGQTASYRNYLYANMETP